MTELTDGWLGARGNVPDVLPGMGRVQRRKARTRERILEIAEEMVRARGVEGVTIDEITDAADIARRSFYNLFPSKHAVLVPIARAHTRSLNRRIDRLVARVSDPAEVISIGLRHTLRGIVEDPLCGWFVLHSGLPLDRLREGIGASGARDIDRGAREGRFSIPNAAALETMLGAAVVGVVTARLAGALSEAGMDDAVAYVLRALGVPPAEAFEIARRPLPPLPAGPGDDAPPAPSAKKKTRRTA